TVESIAVHRTCRSGQAIDSVSMLVQFFTSPDTRSMTMRSGAHGLGVAAAPSGLAAVGQNGERAKPASPPRSGERPWCLAARRACSRVLEEEPHHLATGIWAAWLGVRSGSAPA